jgi:hypothetical protein
MCRNGVAHDMQLQLERVEVQDLSVNDELGPADHDPQLKIILQVQALEVSGSLMSRTSVLKSRITAIVEARRLATGRKGRDCALEQS